MLQIRIGSSQVIYAAKRFYYIGNDSDLPVSNEDNVKHLREELVRQKVAQQSLSKFDEQLKSSKTNAYGIY